jgi:hypothetical protein
MNQMDPDYEIQPPPLEERLETETDVAHNDDPRPEPGGPEVPEGYRDVAEFLTEARDEFAADLEADKENREEGIKDLEFLAIDQWDETVRKERERLGRPCITINTLPQFVGQVVGDRRMNKTSIRLVPKHNASVEESETRAGIVRSIEAQSKAERVYDAALEDQVSGGIGNFRIAMDYANDDVFEQDIFIRQIANPFAVVWDRMSVDPTGADAMHCFVQDIVPRKAYEARWGDRAPIPGSFEGGEVGIYKAGWVDKDSVRVTEYWRIKKRPVRLVMLQDGSVHEWSAVLDPATFMPDPKTGQPVMRNTYRKYACMYLITGFEILEGPYELPIDRLPIIRVNGREVRVGERRVRFGLIRWARDPARMRNYWRSVAVETLAMAPKNQWLAQASSVKGREDDFRQAHLTNDPLLVYNDSTEAPTRAQGPQMPAAVLQEAQMNVQDIKDTTGLQDASLGIRSNEVSGKAIMARQREGDIATVIYHDNLASAIEEGGRVINQLIPVAYDTVRTLRVIGQDDKVKEIVVNKPGDPNSIDLSKGKYDVEIITGPSYTTQRMFAAEAMLEAMKVAPQLMEVAGDLLVEHQDWPGAVQIAERLKKAMPPELTKDPNKPPTPEEAQQQAMELQQQQMQQAAAEEQAEYQTKLAELELAEKTALVQKLNEEARRARADADAAESKAEREELGLQADAKLAGLRVGREAYDLANREEPSRSASDSKDRPRSTSGSQSGRQQSRRPKPKGKK